MSHGTTFNSQSLVLHVHLLPNPWKENNDCFKGKENTLFKPEK